MVIRVMVNMFQRMHPQRSSSKRQIVKQADLIDVCLMPDVFSALKDAFSSLSHWRLVCGEKEDESASTDTSKESLTSLVLPLSCLVVLRLRDAAELR